MKLGINGTGLVQKASVATVVKHAQQAATDGFAHYWLAEHPTGGFDALTVLGAVGQKIAAMELGTAIVPTFPRHPMVLAGQVQTTADMIDAPLTLGVGLSHAVMMAQLGIAFDKPIRHLREYLSILVPLLRTGKVNFRGKLLSCEAQMFQAPDKQVPVVVAALGPQALRVCGELADGTTLAWVGPKTIRDHIVPRLTEAATAAGRPKPRVIATLPVCVTPTPDKVRHAIHTNLALYGQLPSYRAMFDREGVAGPADVAVVGSRAEVEDALSELSAAGVTDFAASEFCLNASEREATRTTLNAYIAKTGA